MIKGTLSFGTKDVAYRDEESTLLAHPPQLNGKIRTLPVFKQGQKINTTLFKNTLFKEVHIKENSWFIGSSYYND